jgi:predicted hydrocarbon binding protein
MGLGGIAHFLPSRKWDIIPALVGGEEDGDGLQGVRHTYCYCSRGWMKETFETVVEKPVDVDLVETVKGGGQQCRFTIKL